MFRRLYAAFSATRFARFISRHVAWKLDPWLLRVTRGRLASPLIFPTAVLETRGVRSGEPRKNALIHFRDGDRTVIAASHAGAPTNPGWFYNLRANPDVVFAGTPMRATIVEDPAERERLWRLGDAVFPAYAKYRRNASKSGRTIPLVVLTPR
jgi:deazaflavin-dependent oxidoreductase (nitroreductase family)